MQTIERQPSVIHVQQTASKWKVWVPWALFAVLWADLIRQLSYSWETSEQYAFGWFVPFLALALFWRRWLDRPQFPTLNPSSSRLLFIFCLLLCLFLLPLRVVHEINPDWPLCSWLLAMTVVALSLYAVFLMGGWSYVKHFAFPVCFILVAVQWPWRIEHALTQGLMRLVANLTVEILGWFNLPAFQHGNLIEVNTGVVGIDEACSGIRSFQSTLMGALFLGELYLLLWPRRLLLLAGGIMVAFCLNVVRTLILTWHASTSGIAAINKWHDPAGLTIFFISFACLWLLALWLRRSAPNSQPSTLNPQPSEGPSSILHPPPSGPLRTPHSALPTYLVALGCWAILVIGITEVWYRSHDIRAPGVFHWSVVFPTNNPAYKEIEMSATVRSKIGHDVGSTGAWTGNDGSHWSVYFFRWNPTSIASVLRARIHRPDRCLPAAGLRLVADAGLENFEAAGLQLPFRRYTYETEGKKVHVFFCQWEDGSEKQSGVWSSKQGERIRSVLVGRRNLGQQTLEVILTGPETLDEAAQILRKQLPGLIQIETSPRDLSSLVAQSMDR